MPLDEQEPQRRFKPPPAWAGGGVGWTMAADIVTGTFLWGGIGWLIDRWLGTEPWVMVAGFLIGNGTGIYAAMLHMKRMQQQASKPYVGPPGPAADEPSGG